MQNLLTASQMHDADAYTIKQKQITSIDLMEDAAMAFVGAFKKEVRDKNATVAILCGKGNNGGDGLAIARILHEDKYKNVSVYLINFFAKQSEDYEKNLKRLTKTKVPIFEVTDAEQIKTLDAKLVVDAILGSGLNKPLNGKYANLAKLINELGAKIIAVDVPTGFNGEGPILERYNGVAADLVISFQLPKINFFFPESIKAMGRFKVVNIGLNKEFLKEQVSNFKLTTKADIKKILSPRKPFSHKGTFGHAFIVAGNTSSMGAALLCADACLHAGAGLTTVCLPKSGLTALNTALPEVMAIARNHYLDEDSFEKFAAIAIGPGLGLEEENESLFKNIIALGKPLIVDADALTILSTRKDLLDTLPEGSILTPHLKEFDRIFGQHLTWWQRLESARVEAEKRKIVIVLKNQYTFVCSPLGKVYINQTGNVAMASGGMGDVLTGIITALYAQKYDSLDAATLAVYLHGKAGDQLAKKKFVVIASEIATQIPKTIKKLGFAK